MTLLYFPRADRPLLRVRGGEGGVALYQYNYADMPIMNIQISLKFHAVCAFSKVLQNYNDLGLKEIKLLARVPYLAAVL